MPLVNKQTSLFDKFFKLVHTLVLKVSSVIKKFIIEMNYLNNEHVLGAFFYGSFLTGYNSKGSDIDLHIVFDNSDIN